MPEPFPSAPRTRPAAWAGLVAGPLLAVAAYALLGRTEADLPPGARATAAVATLMAVYWMTEALPLAVTSLLPIVLFPLAGVFPAGDGLPSQIHQAAAPYAHEYIFLFMGGFMIALAIERWNLHRRLALLTVLAVGTRPRRLVGGVMLATALLSMWISNTATTVMMLPIGMSIASLLSERLRGASPEAGRSVSRFAACLMLAIAYAASIGGLGTLIGTPPNVLLAGYLGETFSIEIGFGRWMLFGVPFAGVFLALAWFLLTRWIFPVGLAEIPGGRELIQEELRKLGRPARGEWTVLSVLLLTAALWIAREPLSGWEWLAQRLPAVTRLHDAGIALGAAVLLFIIPVDARRRVFALDWATAARLPWHVLLLFGGGLSLASAVAKTQLADWICRQLPPELPLWALVVLATTVIVFLTELTSNTATASIFLPILGGVAASKGADPRLLVVPAALASSCAFMLPVATPPNAIVFGSGHVRIGDMVKAGFALNGASVLLIPGFTYAAAFWLLGIGRGSGG